MNNDSNHLGKMIKQRRVMIPLTLGKLAAATGVSPSHLGRILPPNVRHKTRRLGKQLNSRRREQE